MNERNLELAAESGLQQRIDNPNEIWGYRDDLERFAKLVRQDEREACAKLCDLHANNGVSFLCAATIRARGNDESLFDN